MFKSALNIIILTTSLFTFNTNADLVRQENKHITLSDISTEYKAPENWHIISQSDFMKNLEYLDSQKERLAELMKNHGGSIHIATYMKHDPNQHTGIIPTIHLYLRSNNAREFSEFKEMMEASIKQLPNLLNDYQVAKPVSTIKIDNHQSIVTGGKYLLHTTDGNQYRIMSTTYALPFDNTFLQVSFSGEDGVHTPEFNNFIASLKLKN